MSTMTENMMNECTDFEDSFLDLFAGIEDAVTGGDLDFNSFPGDPGSDGETSSSGGSVISSHYSSPKSSHLTSSHSTTLGTNRNPFPAMMPCYDFNSQNLYLHQNPSAPLLSKSNKRVRKEMDEDRLIKNRESANRSRLKRKNEKAEMEDAITEYKNRIRTLELENTALMTDNASLHNQNMYLRTLLTEREMDLKKKTAAATTAPGLNGAVSGITVLCLVCMCTVFNDWLPPALRIAQSIGSTSSSHRPSGRVLLSMQDIPSVHMTSAYSDAIESSPQSYFRMGVLVVAVLCYFGYLRFAQRNHSQKGGCVLP
jgi:hypothetical protein